jgi:cathepsin A (carboxypeptidase C)
MNTSLSFAVVGALLVATVAAKLIADPSEKTWIFNGHTHKSTLTATGKGFAPCDVNVDQMSGYFNIQDVNQSQGNKHYFYWAFESRGNPQTDPVILWMTGGPGCSSGLAILAENGPCHIKPDGSLYNNPYSWNNNATVIYVDQPSGVGFSYSARSGYDSNEAEVSEDMYRFTQAFYSANPSYLNNSLFVYGESYGGHFAPATAHRIWQGNQKNEGLHVPLTGVSVGNGLTEPQIQYQYFAELAYNWCITVKGAPCISEAAYKLQVSQIPTCISKIQACQKNRNACADADNFCDNTQMGPYEGTGLNVYDIRIPCEVAGLCYNFSSSVAFFNRGDVQVSLGVADRHITWATCDYTVNGMFGNDWMQNMGKKIPDLLASNIRVMIYAGDMDFICNWIGNKAWTIQLPWANRASFAAAQDRPWYMDEIEAGFVRSVGNNNTNALFSFVQVHGAGHMVPMDQPARILRVVTNFMSDKML